MNNKPVNDSETTLSIQGKATTTFSISIQAPLPISNNYASLLSEYPESTCPVTGVSQVNYGVMLHITVKLHSTFIHLRWLPPERLWMAMAEYGHTSRALQEFHEPGNLTWLLDMLFKNGGILVTALTWTTPWLPTIYDIHDFSISFLRHTFTFRNWHDQSLLLNFGCTRGYLWGSQSFWSF